MGRFTTLIFGALIGAGAALLYAPNTGQRNRELVAEKLSGAFDQVQQLIKDPDAAAKGATEFVQGAAEKGQEFVQEAVESVKPIATGKNDELREKIEAARQRIAEQIAKNAESLEAKKEEAEEVVDDVIDAIEDAVEEAADAIEAAAEEKQD